jgi:hypothetical protein
MLPEKLEFLNKFDRFYRVIINDVKEGKINEAEFYMVIGAKCKAMERERRERVDIKVELPKE